MSCEHYRTTVTNSRRPYAVTSSGAFWFRKRDYSVIIFRRRRCLDCGQRFNTAEIELSVADEMATRNVTEVRKELAKQVADFLLHPKGGEPDHG